MAEELLPVALLPAHGDTEPVVRMLGESVPVERVQVLQDEGDVADPRHQRRRKQRAGEQCQDGQRAAFGPVSLLSESRSSASGSASASSARRDAVNSPARRRAAACLMCRGRPATASSSRCT